ncbi:heparan-alpha-glucosaminide N-acetyltransferase [Apostasia shenzhenica]|uniref:Heparan-alpha-glucosaminide N-acetyltransferase n=1 Tax=Apostasia shenzhenica TaxID=1088818 RepID=A0A2I0A047_9ASPA|nr:heparan-alpha-glucosaminide N-acetyltransferase [Apostasia shenzhenica]
MDSIFVVAEEGVPLLENRQPQHGGGSGGGLTAPAMVGEILPEHQQFTPPQPFNFVDHPVKAGSSDPDQRLASLDIFRGLTVALMILVDDAGGAFPAINHAPWFGVTLADFVMPFFLFGVGVSIALVCRKATNKLATTRKVILRTVKLFCWGVLLQGGYFHGLGNLTYGVDIDRARWLGVLQRISIGYFLAALSEIWLTRNMTVDSALAFMKKYYIQWVVAILLSALYIGLLFGLYVPTWEFEASKGNSTLVVPHYGRQFEIVHCGLRGSLRPPCNAVGYIDRLVLGEKHLYQKPVYRRTKECSMNSPDYGPPPPYSPEWCLAPFDPEGILSSVMAAVTCFTGLQFGHIIVDFKIHMKRILLWTVSSLALLLFGFFVAMLGKSIQNSATYFHPSLITCKLHFCASGLLVLVISGLPLSKPLYTLSYMFLTAGASGIVLTFIYYLVDVKHIRKPALLLQWMGMNALIVYVLAAGELFPAALQGFYWRSPSNNLVDFTESFMQTIFHSKKWGTLAFVILEILFWCLFSGFLHKRRIYFKF